MPSYETLRALVRDEIVQRGEEGADTSSFLARWEEAKDSDALWSLYHELRALPIREDFPYHEPNDLQSIRRARDAGVRRFKMVICEEDLLDRLYGAWLGRVVGCMLGKPVEGWSCERIRQYLEGADAYPLTDYLPPETRTPPEGVPQPYTWCTRGHIRAGERDDDTDYTILGLYLFERHGAGFSTRDVGDAWLHLLPAYQTYTAERQAYINLVNELPLEEVPVYLNPYREWIGARIRADFWGYAAPGCPEQAAEFAYRDAALSHVKNGVYGEMFVAAMIAAAFATQDVVEIIRAGAAEIPAQSREAEMIRDCLAWRRECRSWQEAFERLTNRYYGKYHPVHTVNNDAIVLNALLWGWPDFEKVITIAVMQGMDTDCNGATAGSIWGAAFGAKALPAKWTEPLHDTLYSAVFGFAENRISELAKRSLQQATRVLTGRG
ncbi:MAG: ADP-ribosylglycohydrolase family protein [Armatimonadota bacterium]|nr:ADP-ribosylglycohydrolase family protein [Armatimonadota bacterium]